MKGQRGEIVENLKTFAVGIRIRFIMESEIRFRKIKDGKSADDLIKVTSIKETWKASVSRMKASFG
jgi:hypothetical protein